MTNIFLLIILLFSTFCCVFKVGFAENDKPIMFRSFDESNDSPSKIILWSSRTIEKTEPNKNLEILKTDESKTENNFETKTKSNEIIKEMNIKDTAIDTNYNAKNMIDENLMNDINYFHYDTMPNDEEKIIKEKLNHIKKLNDENKNKLRFENKHNIKPNQIQSVQSNNPLNILSSLFNPFNFAFFLMNQLNHKNNIQMSNINESKKNIKEVKNFEPITSESENVEVQDENDNDNDNDNDYDYISSLKIVYNKPKPKPLLLIKNKKNEKKPLGYFNIENYNKVPIILRGPAPILRTYAFRLPPKWEIMEENKSTEVPITAETSSSIIQKEITQAPCKCTSEDTTKATCNCNNKIKTEALPSTQSDISKMNLKNKNFPKIFLYIRKNK